MTNDYNEFTIYLQGWCGDKNCAGMITVPAGTGWEWRQGLRGWDGDSAAGERYGWGQTVITI